MKIETPLRIKEVVDFSAKSGRREVIVDKYGDIVNLSELVRRANAYAGLREYARHSEGCSAAFGDRYRCRCGFREFDNELRECEEADDESAG